jgi:hypothetical protein
MVFNKKRVFLASTLAAVVVLLLTAGYAGLLFVRARTTAVDQARVREVVSRIREKNEQARKENEQKLVAAMFAPEWPWRLPEDERIFGPVDNTAPILEERQRLHDPAYKWNSRDE